MPKDDRRAELLVLAQQAQAKADAEQDPMAKKAWEDLAIAYRQLVEKANRR
jgi:hypothetical protein